MIQSGVAALEKDMPFPSDCALSWIIRVALNPSILTCWTTSSRRRLRFARSIAGPAQFGPDRQLAV